MVNNLSGPQKNENEPNVKGSLMAEQKIQSSKVISASLWYTISNFLVKGIGFLTIPIFARLLTKTEMGDYSNFLVWLEIIVIVFGFSLEASINRARFDFPGKLDEYCSSILLLGSLLAGTGLAISLLLMSRLKEWLSLDGFYIIIIFVYLFFTHAYSIYLAQQRIFYKYQTSAALSVCYSLATTGLSLILVLWMNDKYLARSIGHVVPIIAISLPLYALLLKEGKSFRWEYIKYALLYCWPFVPHLLSLKILNASDRVMITNMIGREANATYTIANSCVSIVVLLYSSLNTAVSPWVFERLHSGEYEKLKRITRPYVLSFMVMVQLVQLLAPEVLWIVGGQKYLDAKECFLPLFTSVIVQFCYTLYVNIEQYSKKTWAITLGTAIAAIVNVVLNLILIPRYGYVAAAYTTLIGYLVLFMVHYIFVRIIGYKKIYEDKIVFAVIAASLLFQFVIDLLYRNDVIRYIVAGIYLVIVAYVAYNKRHILLKYIKRKKEG